MSSSNLSELPEGEYDGVIDLFFNYPHGIFIVPTKPAVHRICHTVS